uniref:Isoform 3 of PC-esterase domain-containing protein 1A n=1 Tax=Homo sapiens TaxID=9606 RepID=Q9H1Q7-3
MVFCLSSEEPRRPLRSDMVHFQASEVQQLLHNKFVVILGDSIQRAVYKDLVLLLQKDSLLTAAQLKAKYLEDVLEELTYGPAPDLVIINSCLWDLSRYGRCSMESYRENLERVFVRMDQVLPDSCLLVWNMAMPLGERITGGFLLPELQPLAGSLRRDVVEGNFYSATLAGDHCFDVLDLHFHFRHAVQHRHRDGVHWDQHAHRHLSHLLLTHEFFNYNPVEDFSMPPHLGCGPGVNFVPGPLPPPIPGPNPHGQHWGPVVHRGMPRYVPNSPYHVRRMGGPCRQRLRHSERLIHTYKLDRRPPAHSGTWPG